MARSRESVRENKAMQAILRGETPEKRIMVGFNEIPFPFEEYYDEINSWNRI